MANLLDLLSGLLKAGGGDSNISRAIQTSAGPGVAKNIKPSRRSRIQGFGRGLQEIGPALQQIGVGVSGIEGRTSNEETLKALQRLQDLKQGRMKEKDQKQLGVLLEKAMNKPGAKTTLTKKDGTIGVSVSSTLPIDDPGQFVVDEDGNTSQLFDKDGNPISSKAKVRNAPTEGAPKGGVETLTYTQLLKNLGDKTLMKITGEKERHLKEIARRNPDITEQELKDMSTPVWQRNLSTFLKLIPTAGGGGPTVGQVVSQNATPSAQKPNADIASRVQELKKTMTDIQIAKFLRDKNIDPQLYGLNG